MSKEYNYKELFNELDWKTINAGIKVEGYICKYDFEHSFGSIYPFTTENIAGYINEFEFKNKSLLTVGSSSDQIYNAILNGCEDVTLLDINPFAKYYYYLKTAGILSLNREDFLRFFKYKEYYGVFKDNNKAFNKKVFDKFKYHLFQLDEDSYFFWEYLLSKYNPINVREQLFTRDEYNLKMVCESNQYLQNDVAYDYLKKLLLNVNPTFIEDSIFKFESEKKYDNVILSNIATYLNESQIKDMKDNSIKLLKDNGEMLFAYLYNHTEDTKYQEGWCDIYNLENIKTMLSDNELKIKEILGVDSFKFNDDNFIDSALILKKTK